MPEFIKFDLPQVVSGAPYVPVPHPQLPVLSGARLADTFASDETGHTWVDRSLVEVQPDALAELARRNEADGKWTVTSGNSWNVYCYDSSGPVRCRVSTGPRDENWGSGTAIGTNLVLTAGHVVHAGNGGRPHERIWFIPAHPNKKRVYYASHVYVASNWVNRGRFTDDVAILVLREDMDIRGYSSITADIPLHRDPSVQGKHLSWFTICYPFDSPFKKQEEQILDGGLPSDWAFKQGTLYFQAELEAMSGADITPGASGGPWLMRVSPGVPHRRISVGRKLDGSLGAPYDVNGLNSFTRIDKPGVIYTPHFSGRVGTFLREALADIRREGLNSSLELSDE